MSRQVTWYQIKCIECKHEWKDFTRSFGCPGCSSSKIMITSTKKGTL